MEGFFQVIGGFDQIELTDVLMHRYQSMEYLMTLPFEEFLELVIAASRKMEEEQIRQQWNALLPYMYMKQLKFMSFQQYYESCTGATIDRRPAQEIINEILELHGMKSIEDIRYGDI